MDDFFILTGAPGTGKTTIIKSLRERGFQGVDEPARQILAEQRATQGRGVPEQDTDLFRQLLLERSMAQYETSRGSPTPVVFDRGIPDNVAYTLLFGLDTTAEVQASKQHRYNDTVFITPPWKDIYRTDGERKMTFEQTVAFHQLICGVYRDLDYALIEVPIGPIDTRVEFLHRAIG